MEGDTNLNSTNRTMTSRFDHHTLSFRTGTMKNVLYTRLNHSLVFRRVDRLDCYTAFWPRFFGPPLPLGEVSFLDDLLVITNPARVSP